jgi:3-methyladenine DNA glycosylase/8-oxoguanine DNA glycosylase
VTRRGAAVAAVRHLRAADPVLRAIVDRVGACSLAPPGHHDHFGSLARSVVFQQLNGRAAETIHGRFLALFPAAPAPRDVLALSPRRLRAAGLSSAKCAAIRDLASAATDGRLALPVPAGLADDEVVARLTTVRGIGPWTAHMFLMFHLARPDVFPVGDFGLRTAMKRAYRLRGEPSPARLERIALPWRPYRTYATWYLWRSLEGGVATNPAGR